jgi:hypothetical protein
MAEQPEQRRRRRSPAEATQEHAPWKPTPWEAADALAMQRLAAGTANAIEQKRAMKWILTCTGVLDQAFRPGGEDGRRDTDFALGKQSIGLQIMKLARVNLSLIKGEEHGEHS